MPFIVSLASSFVISSYTAANVNLRLQLLKYIPRLTQPFIHGLQRTLDNQNHIPTHSAGESTPRNRLRQGTIWSRQVKLPFSAVLAEELLLMLHGEGLCWAWGRRKVLPAAWRDGHRAAGTAGSSSGNRAPPVKDPAVLGLSPQTCSAEPASCRSANAGVSPGCQQRFSTVDGTAR